MKTRLNTGLRGETAVTGNINMMLTSDPQNYTEISSLFQTFGLHENSGAEDEDNEAMAAAQRSGYGELSSGSKTPGRSLSKTTSTTTYPQRGGAFLVSAPLWVNRTGQGLANTNRSQYLNRSTHNPYKLMGNSDIHPSPQDTTSMTNSTRGSQQQRTNYSYSNSASNNPLLVDSFLTTSAREAISSGGSASAVTRRLPSEHQQSFDSPSSDVRRDGYRSSLPNSDIRPMPVTTVGTLTSIGKEQNLHVNVKQRLRPSASSPNCSLNTSNMAMPVVQPVSPALSGSLVAGRNTTSASDPSLSRTFGSVSTSRLPTSNCPSSLERGLSAVPSYQSFRVCPATAANNTNTNTSGDLEPAPKRHLNSPEAAPHTRSQKFSDYLQHQYSPPANPHLQQEQYGHTMQGQIYPPPPPPPLPPQQQRHLQHPWAYECAHNTHHNYYFTAPERGTYARGATVLEERRQQPPPPPQQQQQQYYGLCTPTNQTSAHPVAGRVVDTEKNADELPTPKPPLRVGSCKVGDEVVLGHNGTLSVQNSQKTDVAWKSPAEAASTTRQRDASSSSGVQMHLAQSPRVKASELAPGATIAAQGKSAKVKAQCADPAPQEQQSAKKVPALSPTAVTASTPVAPSTKRAKSASSTTSTSMTTKPSSGSPTKTSKKKEEACFSVDHYAPILMFVIVKRKAEGQRYASSIPAEDLSVGSHILVEGDRGADLGQVLGHVSIEQMAHDCAIVERMRQYAMQQMLNRRALHNRNGNDSLVERVNVDEADLPQLKEKAALEYVMSLRTWPRVIGPTTAEDIAKLVPQREAERQAYMIAKPIVQQFIENRYLQRVARHEEALAAAAATTPEAASVKGAVTHKKAEQTADLVSPVAGERRVNLTPLSEEELRNLQLSREVVLVDCEYQFTREKITLYVSRPSRSIFVDFRSMQRKLFRTFRCRIWIAYMDEVTEDKDSPNSFVFVPSPSTSANAAMTRRDAKNATQVG